MVAQIHAQQYVVSGRTIDDVNQSAPLPMVKVELLRTDSTRVAVTTTGNNGAFRLETKHAGKYILKASFIGCETHTRDIEFTNKQKTIELKDIKMLPVSAHLSEAQVTALSQQLTIKADTFVYHSKAFRLPPGASLAALIKQLPGLSMDKDGNLTFQGKTVGQILVNGKPFFGDVSQAMANMVSDAVQDVKVYEKTDEEKEFTGTVDTDKQTVVDLKIKKEYMSSWNVNADLGGGTHERYIGKVFATNFTDRRRSAVYGQINNISQNQRVDENGNWQYWGGYGAIYTYRSAGMMHSWDNGKSNQEGGNMRFNFDLNAEHNNQKRININNSVSFLSPTISQFGYASSDTWGRDRSITAVANFTYNIDSLNRLYAYASYGYQDGKTKHHSQSSTFDNEYLGEEPHAALLGGQVPAEAAGRGIYGSENATMDGGRYQNLDLSVNYTHKFAKKGRALMANGNFALGSRRHNGYGLQLYRYFRPDAPQPELLQRQYGTNPDNNKSVQAQLSYREPITKQISWQLYYRFRYRDGDESYNIYDLDRYAEYADMSRPVGSLPTEGDSLEWVRNVENSYFSRTKDVLNRAEFALQGQWTKLEASLNLPVDHMSERLHYDRDNQVLTPSRHYFSFSPRAHLRYRFTKNAQTTLYYRGYSSKSSLTDLLPFTNTADKMSHIVNNPKLKDAWHNVVQWYGRFFNEKRGDSYSYNVSFNNTKNAVVSTLCTDPVTGATVQSKTNVDGNYSIFGYLSTEQPLDSAHRWVLSARVSANYGKDKTFVGTKGNDLGLSQNTYVHPNAHIGLRWRQDIWSVGLSAAYAGDYARYSGTNAYNQNGHTIDIQFSPQVDLPFGLKLNANLIYYERMGYNDELMNHNQWILNASASYSFLKNKALTLQLEGVDLLQQRTAEYHHSGPSSRTFSRTECFLSYVMLHVTYRFNVGGKIVKGE